MEKKLQEYEARPAAFDTVEQSRRTAMLQHLSAINRFEGITSNVIDKRLFQLLATGKISKQEYLDLCLLDAHNTCNI